MGHYAVYLSMIIGSSRLPASRDFHMTSRFPGPWRITEFPNGFAVHDATGRQLGFFYGRAYQPMRLWVPMPRAESSLRFRPHHCKPTVPLDIKPTENGIEARPPQKLPQNE